MIDEFKDRMSQINQGYGKFMEKRARVETLGDLVFWLVFLGLLWVYTWHSDMLEPLIFEKWLGLGSSDPISEGKMRWRRMYSSAFCGGGIVVMAFLYFKNWQKRRRDKNQL